MFFISEDILFCRRLKAQSFLMERCTYACACHFSLDHRFASVHLQGHFCYPFNHVWG